jgi:tetratricopeptide (TPR) repeat protein
MKINLLPITSLSLVLLLSAPNYSATLNNPQIEIATKNLEKLKLSLNVDRTDFDNDVKITSVSQFKDVQPTDDHFIALQSLTERYGIVVAYKDGNFHAEIPLSRGQFAMFLDRGLGIVGELATVATDGKYKDAFKPFSANKLKLKSVAKIKDLTPKSPYYPAVKSLAERYGINFVDTDGKFRPEQPITEKELQTWLIGVFSISQNTQNTSNKSINRGQFVIRFNDTLDAINMRIADWTNSNPKEVNSSDIHPQNNGKSKESVLSGDRQREASNDNAALADYNQAIALNPKNDWAYYKRALLKKDRLNNDYKGAIADYTQAISLNPKFADAYAQRGVLKKDNLRDYPGALSDFDRAISLNPNSAEAYTQRGNLRRYELKDYSSALADLDRAISIEPKHLAYYLRAGVKTEFKDYQGAVADYDRAILISGKMNDWSYYQRGYLKHYKLNDPQGALADYNKAIEIAPKWEAPQKDRQILLSNNSSNNPSNDSEDRNSVSRKQAIVAHNTVIQE